jgi:hypothetical protein
MTYVLIDSPYKKMLTLSENNYTLAEERIHRTFETSEMGNVNFIWSV